MTRYKQELRKRGWKLNVDFPWLPFRRGGTEIVCVKTKVVNDTIEVTIVFNIAIYTEVLDRNFNKIDYTIYYIITQLKSRL